MRISQFLVILSVLHFSGMQAQGIYTEFGQNRIQQQPLPWLLLSSDRSDIYYYGDNLPLAENIRDIITDELPKMEEYLAYKIGNNLQFMVFEGLKDYRQSNIGYRNPQWHSGGVTVIPNDLATLYFNGDYDFLRKQIRKGIADIILREMIFGGTLQERFDRIKSPALPFWFTSGLTDFLAEGWSADHETRLREAFQTRGFGNFNVMEAGQLTLAGHSIWRYLVDEYGPESIATVIFIARYTNSAEAGIMFHTKKELGRFLSEWKSYYLNAFAGGTGMTLPRGKANVPRRISSRTNTAFAMDAEGRRVAMVTNDLGRYDIWLYDLQSGKTRHLYKGGQKLLNQVTDHGFPVIRWKDNNIMLLTYEKRHYSLITLTPEGRIKGSIRLDQFDAVSDFATSSSGDSLLITGVRGDYSDIYVCSKNGRIQRAVTSGREFEHSAMWLGSGGLAWIERSSGADNIIISEGGTGRQVTDFKPGIRLSDLIEYNDSFLGFLGDMSGLTNAWICHTRRKGDIRGQTNYTRSILSQQISSGRSTLGELISVNGHYTLYTSQLSTNPEDESVQVNTLPWISRWRKIDSVFHGRKSGIRQLFRIGADTLKNETIDSVPRKYLYQTGFPRVDYDTARPGRAVQIRKQAQAEISANPILPDYIVTQSDNSTLGSYLFDHQIPGRIMRNPVIMPYLKIALSDLYRNYAMEAGARSNLDLTFTDYHLKAGYYGRRTDHEFFGYRRSRRFDDAGNLYRQNISAAGEYRASLPLDERLRLVSALGYRKELTITKASEKFTLQMPDILKDYLTARFEVLYDNTAALGLNQLKGIRGKLSFNTFTGLTQKSRISFLSADIRKYHVFSNRITLAGRLTAAYDLGREKVAWYVGGVENWTAREQYQPGAQVLDQNTYLLQMWVSNLRGFGRAARVGSSHMVLNAELRIPVVQMFRKQPVSNEFFRNLTFTAFTDAGTAFTGKGPGDPSNPFNTVYLATPNYTMSVTSRRNPWLFGTGFGVRTRILGYFVKYDRAWGFREGQRQSPMDYISLGLDF